MQSTITSDQSFIFSSTMATAVELAALIHTSVLNNLKPNKICPMKKVILVYPRISHKAIV